jgi:hypothetical protein
VRCEVTLVHEHYRMALLLLRVAQGVVTECVLGRWDSSLETEAHIILKNYPLQETLKVSIVVLSSSSSETEIFVN